MKTNITTRLIAQLTPKDKPYDVRDGNLTGFMIRVNVSGKMLYMCEYGRGKRITIGKVGVLSPMQARDKAKEILADAVRGIDPNLIKKAAPALLTIATYIENHYQPWVESNRKRGKESIYRIKIHFVTKMGDKPLAEITPLLIEQWRTQRLNDGVKPTTLNRDIAALKSAISKAVEWELLSTNPLAKLKLSKVDNNCKVRYLDREEQTKFYKAIDDRNEALKSARERGNIWRQERNYPEMPNMQNQIFADHMKPMILLSLNTGLRQGEIFSLTWRDINFASAILTVTGESAKSGKTRHVPLNSTALEVLQSWRKQNQACDSGLVFPSKNNQRFNNVKTAWNYILKKAAISQFRWHDMRHHFASSLVMLGVDLNTVRELLGHTDNKNDTTICAFGAGA